MFVGLAEAGRDSGEGPVHSRIHSQRIDTQSEQTDSEVRSRTPVSVVGALDWRLNGYLSGIGTLPGRVPKRTLWSLQLRGGRASFVWRAPIRDSATADVTPLLVSDGRPWLRDELATVLMARFALPDVSGAVLTSNGDVVFMAVPMRGTHDVLLYRFAGDSRRIWQISRPGPGQLVQLAAFEDYVALIDIPSAGTATGHGARLVVSQLAFEGSSASCVRPMGLWPTERIQRAHLQQVHELEQVHHVGIVNAYLVHGVCTLDLVLRDPLAPLRHGQLWRCFFAAQTGRTSRRLLTTNHVIDATINPWRRGYAQRFAYLACVDAKTALCGLYRLDNNDVDNQWCTMPFAQSPNGLAIVTRPSGDLSHPPWLATILQDCANDTSKILLAPTSALSREHCVLVMLPAGTQLGRSLSWSAAPPRTSPDR